MGDWLKLKLFDVNTSYLFSMLKDETDVRPSLDVKATKKACELMKQLKRQHIVVEGYSGSSQ